MKGVSVKLVQVAAVFVGAVAAVPVAAQTNPQCAAQLLERTRNVCDAAIDGARIFHPVLGMLVTGGNPVLGEPGSLGGLPHFSFTIRANGTRVVTPDLDYSGVGRTVAADDEIVAPAPLLEAAVGVFRGIRVGNLAVDVLGSAQLLPTDQIDDVTVDPDATTVGGVSLSFGYGARVTVLGGAGSAPAVSVSVMRRTLPRVDVGNVPDGDRFAFGTDLTSTAMRLVVGKTFGPLTLAAGYGRDKYTGDAEIFYRDPITDVEQAPIVFSHDDTRSLGFLNIAIGGGPIRLGAELGMQRGKNTALGTTFEDNDPSEDRLFGGAGIRIVF